MEEHDELRGRLNDLIDKLVAEGRYESAEEVLDAMAHLLKEREKKLAVLRAAIEEGEASGPGEPFDLDEFLAEMHREVEDEEARKEKAAR